MTTIRKAVKEDCKAIMKLVQELAVYEKAPNEVTVTEEEFIECGFGKKPIWWAFVACINNEIVGFALYYIRFSTWKGQRMYLEDLYVKESYRGKGIGKNLFDELIAEAQQKQLSAICWQVLNWNEPAINFYKKYNTIFDTEWTNGCLPIN